MNGSHRNTKGRVSSKLPGTSIQIKKLYAFSNYVLTSCGGNVEVRQPRTLLSIAGHIQNSPPSKRHSLASSTQESYGPKLQRGRVEEAALTPVFTAGQEAGERALDEIRPAASSDQRPEPSSLKDASGKLFSICNVDSKIKNLMDFQAIQACRSA